VVFLCSDTSQARLSEEAGHKKSSGEAAGFELVCTPQRDAGAK